MKIIVCMKQVPDTTEVKLDPVSGTLIRDGVPSIINPDDKAGLEAAIRIKEAHGGSVIALSMGPPQADVALREALAMGADEAVLITDRAFGGADTWATSSTIAAAIKKLGEFDLIIAGRQAIDGDTAQVGPQIAEHLGIPQVSYVEEVISADDNSIVLKRQFEDRYHIIEAKLPCLITTLSELNEPRYMSVSGIYDAYREKEVQIFNFVNMEDVVDKANIGLAGSPTRVKQSFTKEAKGQGEKFEVDADEAVRIIIEKLAEKYII